MSSGADAIAAASRTVAALFETAGLQYRKRRTDTWHTWSPVVLHQQQADPMAFDAQAGAELAAQTAVANASDTAVVLEVDDEVRETTPFPGSRPSTWVVQARSAHPGRLRYVLRRSVIARPDGGTGVDRGAAR